MRHGWIRRIVKDFETNAHFQFKFHLWAMGFWIINLVGGTVLMIFDNKDWVSAGVYYVFVVSIYANWDTDYDACSASLAAMHGEELLKR